MPANYVYQVVGALADRYPGYDDGYARPGRDIWMIRPNYDFRYLVSGLGDHAKFVNMNEVTIRVILSADRPAALSRRLGGDLSQPIPDMPLWPVTRRGRPVLLASVSNEWLWGRPNMSVKEWSK